MTTFVTLEHQALTRFTEGSVASRRTSAESFRVSLAKANCVVRALVARRLLTVENVNINPSQLGNVNIPTPNGSTEKVRFTPRFIGQKIEECNHLQKEIDTLAREAGVARFRVLAS